MKLKILYLFFVLGWLAGCSPQSASNNESESLDTMSVDMGKAKKVSIIYPQIVLRETSIDTFSLPFSERNMFPVLKAFYAPYSLEVKTGRQNDYNFKYFDLSRNGASVVHFIFDPDNDKKLDKISILDTTVVDEYGVRIGDTYAEIKGKRKVRFRKATNYDLLTYIFPENSNIYYVIAGELKLTDAELENIRYTLLSDEKLQACTLKQIFWRIPSF